MGLFRSSLGMKKTCRLTEVQSLRKRLYIRKILGVWQLLGFIISDFTPPTACPSGWLVSLGWISLNIPSSCPVQMGDFLQISNTYGQSILSILHFDLYLKTHPGESHNFYAKNLKCRKPNFTVALNIIFPFLIKELKSKRNCHPLITNKKKGTEWQRMRERGRGVTISRLYVKFINQRNLWISTYL